MVFAHTTQSAAPIPLRSRVEIVRNDTLRALVVFVQFKDDRTPGDPQLFERNWPLRSNRARLPGTARQLLAPSPNPPFPEQSLTEYFYRQSNGRFVLFGDVYRTVLITDHPEERYHRPRGGYGDLTVELLNRIDRAGFDFSRYDYNRDGTIDHIFIVVRRDSKRDTKQFVWTGASCLDGRCTGSLVAGGPTQPPRYDGTMVDWNASGSYIIHRTPGNVSPQHYLVRLMAHELGHDLWAPFFVHIPANTSNDVPLEHNRTRNTDCVGYVLMAGNGGAWDCGGSETISAFERDLLDWIECRELGASQNDITIGDLYTRSECFKISIGPRQKWLYLSNLQREGFFDRTVRAGKSAQFEVGLRTTGLLVHLANGRRLDVIPADNNLALGTHQDVYQGDLFGPGTSTQLTPWTRPNSNGYTRYPDFALVNWMAIDRIRYQEGTSGTLVFDFIEDFRERPVIREDSWMGKETRDYVFTGPLLIKRGSTLTIEADISINTSFIAYPGTTIQIASDAEVHLQESGAVHLHPGARLIIEGTLRVDGLLLRSRGSQIIVKEGGLLAENTD